LLPVLFMGIAAILSFVLLRPDPYDMADETAPRPGTPPVEGATSLALWQMLRRPGVGAAVIALVIGQFVMTLIMTMTPLHMTQHGHGLAAVGIVLSGHTLGMFALSPLSGRLAERVGTVQAIFVGTGVLALASVMAAVAPPDGGNLLLIALFLLGVGWNIGFVAGSSLLSEHLEVHERTRVQGAADALIWSAAAGASLGSGVIMAAVGYAALGVLGIGLVFIPILSLQAHRRALAEGERLAR
ncbi:MAG: MFS transporter, partial [Candidatus Limnocylindrales bacterium]